MKKINLNLTDEQNEQLNELKKNLLIPKSVFIREAVRIAIGATLKDERKNNQ